MVCIYCQQKTRVTNSRPQARLNRVWRRRLCTSCGAVFTSLERVSLETAIGVRNTAGGYEPFNENKLLIDVFECLKHRQDALQDAEAITNTILGRLYKYIDAATVSREHIITATREVLARFDTVAAALYDAYHTSK